MSDHCTSLYITVYCCILLYIAVYHCKSHGSESFKRLHSLMPMNVCYALRADGVPDVLRCYSNTAFVTENDFTEEQLREIDRVARVPFTPYDQNEVSNVVELQTLGNDRRV